MNLLDAERASSSLTRGDNRYNKDLPQPDDEADYVNLDSEARAMKGVTRVQLKLAGSAAQPNEH